MPSNWMKQPQQLSAAGGGNLNGGIGDAVVGGLLTGVPSGLNISQGIQTLPGDRMVVGEEDIAALTDTSVNTLYGGILTYVRTPSGSTASATKNCAMFWDTSVAASQFQATPDESGSTGVTLFAGVNIITMTTKGYNWWIQNAGRVTGLFRAVLTGVPATGSAVYLAAAGAGADVGTFDVLDGGGNPTFTQLGDCLNRYVGPAQTAPANATASTFNIPLGRTFRW